jgi:hypothetical protein
MLLRSTINPHSFHLASPLSPPSALAYLARSWACHRCGLLVRLGSTLAAHLEVTLALSWRSLLQRYHISCLGRSSTSISVGKGWRGGCLLYTRVIHTIYLSRKTGSCAGSTEIMYPSVKCNPFAHMPPRCLLRTQMYCISSSHNRPPHSILQT